MTPLDFKDLVNRLTGTPVKECNQDRLLAGVLNNRRRQLDWSQFNELLLLVNKDRVERPFFERFFGPDCSVESLERGVEDFQVAAMLRYGNFIFAYRTLSRIRNQVAFDREIGEVLNEKEEQSAEYAGRGKVLIKIEKIPREDTSLVGYLAPKQLVADAEDGTLLLACVKQAGDGPTWPDVEAQLEAAGNPERVTKIVSKYRGQNPAAKPTAFSADLLRLVPGIKKRADNVATVQQAAARNQDIYLTWDHMDVYFATSMRKVWEFADLYDFINHVVKSDHLKGLKLRHFDPTQCYTRNRIDKGLVESLMLKRAKCTVYSVQDTDTLGKDSELAATLAQGKPVIAYVPDKPVAARARELEKEDPATILDRLRFVMYADDRLMAEVSADDFAFVREYNELSQFVFNSPFRSVPDEPSVKAFRSKEKSNMARLCRLIADSEKRIYDSRANTLKEFHPLGIQVNLDTGVANGVLVVRSAENCAKLLRAILTRSMDCYPEFDPKENMWHLRERISGSIFRVVTGNRQIYNCFWNFYLRNENLRTQQ
ncbi:MAG: hypothetical protein WD733_06590 [Bryobacterales bacterium]